MNVFGLSISQWLPCPVFALDDKILYIVNTVVVVIVVVVVVIVVVAVVSITNIIIVQFENMMI